MPRISVDLTKIDAVTDASGGFKATLLPPDRSPYILRVRQVENQKSKNDNAMLVFDFDVLEPVDLAEETLRQWYVLVKRGPAYGRLKALVDACAVPIDRQGFNTDDFVDAVFECDLIIEPSDDGREFNRIDRPRPAPEIAGAGEVPQEGEEPQPSEEPPAAGPVRRAPSRARTAGTAPRPPRRAAR